MAGPQILHIINCAGLLGKTFLFEFTPKIHLFYLDSLHAKLNSHYGVTRESVQKD